MSSIAGGIANKIGNYYEYNYVITKIIDVIENIRDGVNYCNNRDTEL